MKRSNNIIVSLILVLLIVVFVSKALQNSYSQIESKQLAKKKIDKVVLQQHSNELQKNNDVKTDKNKLKVIVIDPAHGSKANLEKEPIAPNSNEIKIKDDGGTEGVISKTPEYLINMAVAVKLKESLENRGYTVKMTKTSNLQIPGNIERAQIGNKENASLVIRIYADSNENPSVKGASVLIPEAVNENTRTIKDSSARYGAIILDTLAKEVSMQNKGLIKRSDITEFNWSKVPIVLVQMGFLSNPEEDKLLNTASYQDKIAKALSDGIDKGIR